MCTFLFEATTCAFRNSMSYENSIFPREMWGKALEIRTISPKLQIDILPYPTQFHLPLAITLPPVLFLDLMLVVVEDLIQKDNSDKWRNAIAICKLFSLLLGQNRSQFMSFSNSMKMQPCVEGLGGPFLNFYKIVYWIKPICKLLL